MIEIIFIIIIFYFVFKKSKTNLPSTLFYKIMKMKNFANLKSISSSSTSIIYMTADADGENFLFAIKNIGTIITKNEIISMYELSKKLHIHNLVFVISSVNNPDILKELKSYNIELWDSQKMVSLINNSTNDNLTYKKDTNVLHTSDTSDDKCTIDSSFNPIMDGDSNKNSIFKNLFNKPDRL